MLETEVRMRSPRTEIRVALVGRSGAGKSEVSRLFSTMAQCRVVKTGTICRSISQMLFGNESKRSTQLLDNALTAIDGSIFLRAAMRDLGEEAALIDSLRFHSDFELARNAGFRILRVTAPDELRYPRLAGRGQEFDPATDGLHRSETELDEVDTDYHIENRGGLDDLKIRVFEIIDRW